MTKQKNKTKVLPPFTGHRSKKDVIARFVFDHEPEGVEASNQFRRELVRVLNAAQGARWVDSPKEEGKAQG